MVRLSEIADNYLDLFLDCILHFDCIIYNVVSFLKNINFVK